MVCENCGAQIEDKLLTVYCKKCGHKLSGRTGQQEEAQGAETQEKKTGRGLVKWCLAALGGVLLIGVVVLLVWTQGPTKVPKEIYGQWSDENGVLSLTFQEDGSVRVGAGSGFFGADLFTYTKGDGNTLYLKANADGVLGMVSLQLDYDLQGDSLKVTVFGVDYLLERK